MSICEAGRNTGTPMSTSRPPLIFLVTLPETGSPSFLRLHDGFPVDDPISLALGDADGVVFIINVFDEDLDHVADLHILRLVKLALFEDALGLEAELDDEVVAGDGRRSGP